MKRRFTSLALICVLVAGGWFFLSFRPASNRLGELRAEVKRNRDEVSALEAKLKRLIALQRNERGARDEANRRLAALPNDPKVSDFIVQVQDAANAAGIDFLSISPSLPAAPQGSGAALPAAPASPAPTASPSPQTGQSQTPAAPESRLRSITVQIKADGQYFEIEDFVLKLEQLARAVRIDDLTLSAEQGGETLSASFKLQMFMVTPQAAASPAPSGQTSDTSEG
jgi:Tfp pilus assembly protein PilO